MTSYIRNGKIVSIRLGQWFLTFFAPWTPKSLNKFHGPLKYLYIQLADPLIPVKVVYLGTILYFSDLHGPPRPSTRTLLRAYGLGD